jgi:hypothetical protein
MIYKYTHKTIDKTKYSVCLHQCLNYRIYAELWYLSIVSPDGYDVLVLNDYEAVMPIPYQKKLGFKFVIQPIFCQQLGIFYKENVSVEIFNLFLSFLTKYKVRSYCFNEENTPYFPSDYLKRDNQVLNLDCDYLTLLNNYNTNKKRVLKNYSLSNIRIEEKYTGSIVTGLLGKNLNRILLASQLNILNTLLQELDRKKVLKQYTLFNKENIPIVYLWLIFSKGRIINLLSIRIKESEIKNSYAYLIDTVIKNYSNQKLIFDFEGSMIVGIANFNKSFGATTNYYVFYRNFKWLDKFKNINII